MRKEEKTKVGGTQMCNHRDDEKKKKRLYMDRHIDHPVLESC